MSIAFYLAVIACLLLLPQHTARAARDALSIWGLDVAPSLFPYMIFCRLLSSKLRERRVPAAPAAALLGALGGSPSGASLLAACSGDLPPRTLLALCALTGTISPMFMLGTMQSWTQDATLCRLLLACHLFGAVFSCGCVYLAYRKNPPLLRRAPSSAQAAQDNAIMQSVDAILQVGGCIICYSVLASLLRLLPFAKGGLGAVLHSLVEISGGMHALCQADMPGAVRAVLLSALSGFSGLSILSQNHAFLHPLGVSMAHLLVFALLRALGAGGLMALLFPIFLT